MAETTMFCRQCEQTAQGKACTRMGVCGKDPETAVLQDLLIHVCTGIGAIGAKARELGVRDAETDRFLKEALFSTITNVNFDPARLRGIVLRGWGLREKMRTLFIEAHRKKTGADYTGAWPEAASEAPALSPDDMLARGAQVGLLAHPEIPDDARSLRELILFGLKGMAAYADHAEVLGKTDETVEAFFHTGLAALADTSLDADRLTALVLELGTVNLKCMEILDAAHTARFGDPVPTKVSLGARKGPAILVSGHDLPDLEMLLEQTAGTGICVYTHGEMLPAHGYPKLKKHPHFAGHYGGAWQEQQKEFDAFPGAILMTTNCIQKPRDGYRGRIFTTGLVAYPDVAHIAAGPGGKKDFSAVIAAAKAAGGFPADVPGKEITVGFGHATVLSLAGTVLDAVKAGKIRRFFLIGGCDGAKSGRNYYTDFAKAVPRDCVILTLACGKFRFNKLDFGDIGGIPRLLDCGQCNDAYSAIVIASALAKAAGCTVNELPLSLILSWYEQKAVCILITLLSLGIKNIRLGPSLPAFVTPGVLNVLVEKFGIKPISTVEQDLRDCLK